MPDNYQGIEYSRRVYFHDTDAGGVVYHGNYFRFCEEARTDIFLKLLHMSIKEFDTKYAINFVISHVEVDYKRPVSYDDIVKVKTFIEDVGVVRTKYRHEIYVGETLCALVKLEVAAISSHTFRPAKMPADLLNIYKQGFGL
jgi:acyl-CoA thioester hydrolase